MKKIFVGRASDRDSMRPLMEESPDEASTESGCVGIAVGSTHGRYLPGSPRKSLLRCTAAHLSRGTGMSSTTGTVTNNPGTR